MSEVKTRKPRAKAAATGEAATSPVVPVVLNEVRIVNKVFNAALGRATSLIARTNTLPILGCVSLVAGNGRLTIESSNMEQAMRQSVEITGQGFGGGCVDAERLVSVVKRLPADAETTLDFTGAALVLRCGTVRATLTAWPVADFPVFSVRDEESVSFAMPGIALATILEAVDHAVSQEQTRFYLCGVCLEAVGEGEDARLRAAATNGNDLALATTALPEGAETMPRIIIPSPVAAELKKTLRGHEVVDLKVNPAAIVVTMGDLVLSSKLISASFPNCDRVVPGPGPHVLTVSPKALIDVIELASLFTKDEKKKPWVRMAFTDRGVGVRGGEGNDQIVAELPADSFIYAGPRLELNLTAFSLVEPAKVMATWRPEARLVFSLWPEAPFLCVPTEGEDVIFVSGPLKG